MRDHFGQDGTTTDGTPAADPTAADPTAVSPAVGLAASPVIAPAPAVASLPAAPTLQQAVNKAVAKADSDAIVATVPDATHHTKLEPCSPIVLGSTAVGAGIGALVGGPPGAAAGAAIGWLSERYMVLGGPLGKVWEGLRHGVKKITASTQGQ
jgi:hypothetical protein